MVNHVTPELFRRWGTPEKLAAAEPGEVEALVRPTGFFRQKAKSIQATAQDIVSRFGGEVPRTLEELHHAARRGAQDRERRARQLLRRARPDRRHAHDAREPAPAPHARDDPVKIERDLMELIPAREWTLYTHRVIQHGRVCCDARRPQCEGCPLRAECPCPGSPAARAKKKRA